MTKPTRWHVHQAKTQISLGIRLWSDMADAQADLSLRWVHVILLVLSCLKWVKVWDKRWMKFEPQHDKTNKIVCLCWGLTSQSTFFQSCRDGATASWVINQFFRGVKCLAQGHNMAAVGFEPPTSRSGVRHSTTEPPRSLTNKMTCLPSEDSVQPAHLPSFAVRIISLVYSCSGSNLLLEKQSHAFSTEIGIRKINIIFKQILPGKAFLNSKIWLL